MPAAGYIPLAARARHAIVAIAFSVLVEIVVCVTDVAALPLLDDPTDVDALSRFDRLTGIPTLFELASWLLAAIFFIRWFSAAHRNIDALSGTRRHPTWWSIGGWFVPVMALFRPKQILDDMLDCSLGVAVRPWWAATWWGTWIVASIASNVAGRAFFGNTDSLDSLGTATSADAVASALTVIAAPFAVIVIRRVTEAMELRRSAPASGNPFEPALGAVAPA